MYIYIFTQIRKYRYSPTRGSFLIIGEAEDNLTAGSRELRELKDYYY